MNAEYLCQQEILKLLREELQPKEREEYPIEQWYRSFYLEPGRGFSPYGGAVADFLENRRGQFDRFAEVGAGIGQNCVQLAARGWKTVALEPVARQWEMMGQLLDRVQAIAPEVRARIQTHRVAYPKPADEYLDPRTVVGFFSLVSASSERDWLEGLRHAGGVILDALTFQRVRSPEEQDALFKEIEALGFAPPVPVWDNLGGPANAFRKLRVVFLERIE